MQFQIVLQVGNGDLVPVLFRQLRVQCLVENVYFGRGELSGLDALLKQQIKFRESSARGFGDSEICINDTKATDAGL